MAQRDYPSEEITVHWDSEVCIHSRYCFRRLRTVFRPTERPWIVVSGADDDEIVETIDGCPSGALSYTRHAAAGDDEPDPVGGMTRRTADQ